MVPRKTPSVSKAGSSWTERNSAARSTARHPGIRAFTLLERIAPNSMFALNRAVAVAMANGPREGLAQLASIEQDERLVGHHRLEAVRAHMLELGGDRTGAIAAYRTAARLTTSLPERRYLESRAAAI